MRAQFISNGTLQNTLDTNFRAINDNWPVFGFAKDLGNVTGATDAAVFSIGLVRDPAIRELLLTSQVAQLLMRAL